MWRTTWCSEGGQGRTVICAVLVLLLLVTAAPAPPAAWLRATATEILMPCWAGNNNCRDYPALVTEEDAGGGGGGGGGDGAGEETDEYEPAALHLCEQQQRKPGRVARVIVPGRGGGQAGQETPSRRHPAALVLSPHPAQLHRGGGVDHQLASILTTGPADHSAARPSSFRSTTRRRMK